MRPLVILTSLICSFFLQGFVPLSVVAEETISGFYDNFERSSLDTTWQGSSHTIWHNSSPQTYQLDIINHALNVTYTRDNESGDNDNFNFDPPLEIDASEWPKITLDIKSDTDIELTLRVRYSLFKYFDHQRALPGDEQWHTYTFFLDETAAAEETIERIFFYFDKDSGSEKNGIVKLDNFKVAGFGVKVSELQAETLGPQSIKLNWVSGDPAAVDYYNIYRDTESDFPANEETLAGTSKINEFVDEELAEDTFYYYTVSAVDTSGFEHFSQVEIRQPAYDKTLSPEIDITGTFPSDGQVKRYEKFMIGINFQNALYENPYDPEDIDFYGNFVSPRGDTTRINGFYNGSEGWDMWMLRFAPFETGEWQYQLFVNDVRGSGESVKRNITVKESDHSGPLTVSPENSNYLMHHDSTSFFGNAVYYPWNVTTSGLDKLKESGGNLFGYWNSTYDNAGNGGGSYLLESMDSGLGRYDQRMAGRLDQILEWAEERDLKMMYAIWAHDWLRIRGQPWNVEHSHWYENPYSEYFDPVEFYTDPEARAQQKKQYRYIIARWGYSRALGIWELVNEMHGTTGFARDAQAGIDWTTWMHNYFKENDPYNRPTTVEFGDAGIYTRDDLEVDMPNLHYYEDHYPRVYEDDVRDGLHHLINVSRELKAAGDKPATLGEAGYYRVRAEAATHDYTQNIHNAYWSNVAIGMATTPFWWEFNQNRIFTNERMAIFGNIQDFVSDIDFAHTKFEPSEISFEGSKALGLAADSIGLGWLWHNDLTLSEKQLRIEGLSNSTYEVEWYDTWAGETISTHTRVSAEGVMPDRLPSMYEDQQDIAFKFNQIDNGTEASALNLFLKEFDIILDDNDTPEEYTLLLFISDDEERLVTSEDREITFSLSGPGELQAQSIMTSEGSASVAYLPEKDGSGNITITAEADGLETAMWSGEVITSSQDSEAQYDKPEEYQLEQNYPNPFNPVTTINYTLPESGQVSLAIYDIMGRRIKTIVEQYQDSGNYSVSFDGTGLSSGTYIYLLKVSTTNPDGVGTGEFSKSRSMMLLK